MTCLHPQRQTEDYMIFFFKVRLLFCRFRRSGKDKVGPARTGGTDVDP
jgi:hypothetical protein